MSARAKLEHVLQTIEQAQSYLTTATNSAEHAQHYARLAKRELQDAASKVQEALKELPGRE